MTTYQFLTTIFYASLALFALLGTVRSPPKRLLGIVLALCWAVSNIVFWALPVDWRPLIFPLLDVIFALCAAKIGLETGSKVPLVLISLSVLAMLMNAAFSIVGGPNLAQTNAYEITLNAIFAMQCIVTGTWGLADEFGRIDYFPWRRRNRGGAAQPSGASTKDETG